mmetsp:Transcript_83774/g.242283  ORF Transcript_83774/g.242283 Transcript_83774/m.242283 type:complete len:200 (+) Transcript_83774:1298-1897(+)
MDDTPTVLRRQLLQAVRVQRLACWRDREQVARSRAATGAGRPDVLLRHPTRPAAGGQLRAALQRAGERGRGGAGSSGAHAPLPALPRLPSGLVDGVRLARISLLRSIPLVRYLRLAELRQLGQGDARLRPGEGLVGTGVRAVRVGCPVAGFGVHVAGQPGAGRSLRSWRLGIRALLFRRTLLLDLLSQDRLGMRLAIEG